MIPKSLHTVTALAKPGAYLMETSALNSTMAAERAAGLRYFRVRTDAQPLGEREFTCPASEEAGKRKTCAECGACNGSAKPSAASVAIVAHGTKAVRFYRMVAAQGAQ